MRYLIKIILDKFIFFILFFFNLTNILLNIKKIVNADLIINQNMRLGFGNIFYKKKVGGMGKKPQWRYRASHRLALKFANKVLPHSIVKKKKLQDIVDHYGDKAKNNI